MLYGIVDENKKFILLDYNRDTLVTTALSLAKKTEDGYEPMFTEETIGDAVGEYEESDIEIAYNNERYLKGYAPAIDNEYQREMREKAYVAEVDPITAHIQRLRDDDPESEEIATLIAERTAKRDEIKARYPYAE